MRRAPLDLGKVCAQQSALSLHMCVDAMDGNPFRWWEWLARMRAVAVLLVACALSVEAAAHEPPADVRINTFVKPAADRLELVVRVPMTAMQEVDVPTRGPGYLDMARADAALRNAAKLWLVNNIDVYENDRRLPAPEILRARVSLPSDRSFTSYERARAHLDGPSLANDLDLYWSQ